MAQADSVRSSSRQLITGESANQSTNLRALNLPAVAVSPANRRYVIGSWDARVIGSDGAPLPRPWREKRGDDPEDLFRCRYYGTNTGQAPVGSNIVALGYANAAFFLGWLLRKIVQILLLFVRTNKRFRSGAFDKPSSNQLVPSRPQGRLR